MVYVPYWRRGPSGVSIAVRTVGEPAAAAAAVRAAVWSLDPALPIANLQTMAQVERRHLAERRFQTELVGLFGGVSLLLACLGTYSCIAFSVARRRTEFGVRLALGARAPEIGWLVLHQGLRPVVLGLVVGLATALALGRALTSLLFGVTPHDPLTLIAVVLVMLGAAAAACWLPTRRASRLDPATILRGE
jgi:ABC-type antimicrobial peptide transport system permease subunit